MFILTEEQRNEVYAILGTISGTHPDPRKRARFVYNTLFPICPFEDLQKAIETMIEIAEIDQSDIRTITGAPDDQEHQ